MNLRTLLMAACAAMALAGGPAFAQQDDQSTPQAESGTQSTVDQGGKQDAPNHDRMRAGEMGESCPRMDDMMVHRGKKGYGMRMPSRPMMEARLAYIKADLEITEAQMPQWDAYADAVRARHESMVTMHKDMKKAKEDGALERMDARINAMQTMADGLKALKGPTEALYGALDDEQKKKADKLLGGPCGMM